MLEHRAQEVALLAGRSLGPPNERPPADGFSPATARPLPAREDRRSREPRRPHLARPIEQGRALRRQEPRASQSGRPRKPVAPVTSTRSPRNSSANSSCHDIASDPWARSRLPPVRQWILSAARLFAAIRGRPFAHNAAACIRATQPAAAAEALMGQPGRHPQNREDRSSRATCLP